MQPSVAFQGIARPLPARLGAAQVGAQREQVAAHAILRGLPRHLGAPQGESKLTVVEHHQFLPLADRVTHRGVNRNPRARRFR